MSTLIEGYLKEVPDVEHVSEVIAEQFDDALEFMTPNTIVYGGAVRDVLADLPLVGDLDLAVAPAELETLRYAFETSAKWVDSDMLERTASVPILGKSPFGLPSMPMAGITQFSTINGATVQLIASASFQKGNLEKALYMARQVDIVCCGVVLLSDGRVFEALPGAYEDCRNRVLRINEYSDTIYVDALPSRVEKLVGRGWKSDIDVRSTMANLNRKRAKKAKKSVVSGNADLDLAKNRITVFDYRSSGITDSKIQPSMARLVSEDRLAAVRTALRAYASRKGIRIVTKYARKHGKLDIFAEKQFMADIDKIHAKAQPLSKTKMKGTY